MRLKPKKKFGHYDGKPANMVQMLHFRHLKPQNSSLIGKRTFSFLNLSLTFDKDIDWGYQGYGKLWNYNLQYLGEIHQRDLDYSLFLIRDINYAIATGKIELEPYPVSLRSINVIKFVCQYTRQDPDIIKHLFAELNFLDQNMEYHLLGNHLLENAFALSMGGAFFYEKTWMKKGLSLLKQQLDEQILADGAHFELSPMYHNIIFYRLLEFIDWYGQYEQREEEFLEHCFTTASKMRSWLEKIRFANGDIPLFNDAAKAIAYDTTFLIDYADILHVHSADIPLGQSGYRSYSNNNYEIKLDLAQIGASYQPGHAHADALSFIVYNQGEPLFVEQGTSTYQIGDRRSLERSTEAHNTVVVNGKNQSEVWGGFRVGKRAHTTILEEKSDGFEASHDGYRSQRVMHVRKFVLEETQIEIKDSLSNPVKAKAYLHLHPERNLSELTDNLFVIGDDILVEFAGAKSIEIEEYDYVESYNQYHQAKRLVISFDQELCTKVLFS